MGFLGRRRSVEQGRKVREKDDDSPLYRDRALIEKPAFQELWLRNVEESVRHGSIMPFVEEVVLQVSSQPECESTGFLGPLHLWQGMADEVVPPAVTDYVARVLPRA
ncbi:hypothetical protein MLD38_027210 [Melastoma candidum]|uniref:Uncharacterized protein n=1 Tax=Melastoma candidum TaxID=119954 RepID=A0ACB9P5P4_9MYRT|nr:hypothetical protein MLD38_027210 [Melastoma candidum]